jgi:hypothetical protein
LHAVKHLIGRLNDKDVENIENLVPYSIVKSDSNDNTWVMAQRQKYRHRLLYGPRKEEGDCQKFLRVDCHESCSLPYMPNFIVNVSPLSTKDAGGITGAGVALVAHVAIPSQKVISHAILQQKEAELLSQLIL